MTRPGREARRTLGGMRWTRVIAAAGGLALGAVGGVGPGGCGSTPRLPETAAAPLPENRPRDFELAVTVLSPPGARDQADQSELMDEEGQFGPPPGSGPKLPRSLRPARYIVEADAVLRVAEGEGAKTTTFPLRTRQLSSRQFDALWRQLRQSNLLAPGNPARIDAPEDAIRSPDRTVALIYTSYESQRVTLRVLLDRRSEDAIAAERLVDRLAELAWIRD
jgi:hypothetical protein